jgi:Bax protein
MPADLDRILDTDERKTLFFSLVLPAVLHVNETILEDRARLERLRTAERAGRRIAAADRKWLHALAVRYDTAPELAALLSHADIVPPSLALAQAAIESGWGTSRFALEGNALFGQRVYGEGNGIVPAALRSPAFRVRAFDDIVAAVEAYALNLNSNAAHAPFRKRRAELRWKGLPLDGATLAATLKAYSERGLAYTADVRALIRGNGLDDFDTARLAGPRTAVRPVPPGNETIETRVEFRTARAEID